MDRRRGGSKIGMQSLLLHLLHLKALAQSLEESGLAVVSRLLRQDHERALVAHRHKCVDEVGVVVFVPASRERGRGGARDEWGVQILTGLTGKYIQLQYSIDHDLLMLSCRHLCRSPHLRMFPLPPHEHRYSRAGCDVRR